MTKDTNNTAETNRSTKLPLQATRSKNVSIHDATTTAAATANPLENNYDVIVNTLNKFLTNLVIQTLLFHSKGHKRFY